MKKIFTLALALLGFAGAANAETVDDLAVLKHSYVLVIDDYSNNGTKAIDPGLIGDDHFLVLKQMPAAANKGTADLSTESEYVTADIVSKYGEYGEHLNSARLKDNSITMAMNLTAGSKVIMFIQGNNKEGKEARIPRISKKSDLSEPLNEAPAEGHPTTIAGYRWEITVDDDGVYYVGSYNGDMFVSYIIIEANEAEGTPMVKVGNQVYENGLYFKEVTCTPMPATMFGESFPTVVTYTTDGTAPTDESPKYTNPIKCYSNQIVKFQAFMDFGGGAVDPEGILDGADNEAAVNFQFNAPTITAEGGNVTIISEYNGAKNYYIISPDTIGVEGSSVTLTESATVEAYSEIKNGDYATFTTKSTSKDIYVLNPIKEKKTIKITAGDVEVDEEATANDKDNNTIYMVKNGAISADKADFFVKNLEFAVVKDEKYQIEGEERYIKMNNTNISFEVANGDSVAVKVVCSKNSCKTIDADEDKANERQCWVNVDGTTYGGKDVTLEEDAHIIEFTLGPGVHTFLKYSGTGNIMIYSIEITPMIGAGISAVAGEQNVNAPAYNLAGQKVDASYKGVVIKNGQKLIQK